MRSPSLLRAGALAVVLAAAPGCGDETGPVTAARDGAFLVEGAVEKPFEMDVAELATLPVRELDVAYESSKGEQLDWNAPSIAFYESLGARAVEGWTRYRWLAPSGDDHA